jgi:transposase
MKLEELSDEQWDLIRPLLPPPAKTSRPRADDRRTVNAILYVLTTGCSWMDIPKKYGSDSTAHDRLKMWARNNVWTNILQRVVEKGCASGKLSLDRVAVDSSNVAAKKGGSNRV